MDNEIEGFDLEGKEIFAQNVTNALKTELENKLVDYKKASGNNKKRIGEEIIQKYGISNSDLATAEKNIPEIIRGTILKSSNAENNLKEILNNKNLNDSEKVEEIDRKFGISVTIDDLKNNSQVSQEIIKNASLERIVAQDTDKIANKMRWESEFFKDYIANTQRLTNRRIVVDEDDNLWFVNKDGKLDPELLTQSDKSEIIPKGKISFITENYIEEKGKKTRIKDSFQPENVIQKDKNEIITENPIVWKNKNLSKGNELIESVIKSKKLNTVLNIENSEGIGVIPYDQDNAQNFEGSDTFLLISFDNSKNLYKALEKYDETGVPVVRQEESFSYQTLAHEKDHVKKMQNGMDKSNIPVYEIYRDSSSELHFSGEITKNISIQNQTPSKIVDNVIEELNKVYEEQKGKNEKNDKIIGQTLNELNNKKSNLYKYFSKGVEEKYKNAQKSKESFININVPFFNEMNMSEKEAIETETKVLHEQGIKFKDRVVY